VDIVRQNVQTLHCEFLTDSKQTVGHNTGHNDTEPKDGTEGNTDRQ